MELEMILMDILIATIGLALLGGGYGLRVWVNRRRFYRRGPGGLQHFSRYSKAVLISMFEGFLMFVSIPLIILGIIVLFFFGIRLVDRGKYKIETPEKTESIRSISKVRFLGQAEEGFGRN